MDGIKAICEFCGNVAVAAEPWLKWLLVITMMVWLVMAIRQSGVWEREWRAFGRYSPLHRLFICLLCCMFAWFGGTKEGGNRSGGAALRGTRQSGEPVRSLPGEAGNEMISYNYFDVSTNGVEFGASWSTNIFDLAVSRKLGLYMSTNLGEQVWLHLNDFTVPYGVHYHEWALDSFNGDMLFLRLEAEYDSDEDGLTDAQELLVYLTDADDADTDGDGVSDGDEILTHTSNPFNSDTDGDGLYDGWEAEHGLSLIAYNDPLDYDMDGLANGLETSLGTNMFIADTDGDGIADGEEAAYIGYDDEFPWFNLSGGTILDNTPDDTGKIFRFDLPSAISMGSCNCNKVAVDLNGLIYIGTDASTSNLFSRTWGSNFSFTTISASNTTVAAYWTFLKLRGELNSVISTGTVQHGEKSYCVVEFSHVGMYTLGSPVTNQVNFQVSIPLAGETNVVYVKYGEVADSRGLQTALGAQLPARQQNLPLFYGTTMPPVTNGMTVVYHLGCGSSALNPDSDGDGLSDGNEIAFSCNPWKSDTDGDGMMDGWEIEHGMDALSAEGDDGALGDIDEDGLENIEEYLNNTSAEDDDTDNDGLTDLEELGGSTNDSLPWLTLAQYTELNSMFQQMDDAVVNVILPQETVIDGEAVTNITVDINGLVHFNRKGFVFSNSMNYAQRFGGTSAFSANALSIAPYWRDLYLTSNTPASHIKFGTATSGTNTYYVVEYDNTCTYGDRSRNGTINAVSWQLAFKAGNADRVYLRYKDVLGNADGREASIGFSAFEKRRAYSYGYNRAGSISEGKSFAFVFGTGSDPLRADCDYDGLLDGQEVALGTDLYQPDTDGDGMNDGWEYAYGFDPNVDNDTDNDEDNDADADPDGDGINNAEECAYGLDPESTDTDGDGVADNVELAQNSDPADYGDGGEPNSRVSVPFNFGDPSTSCSEKYQLSVTAIAGSGARPSSFNWVNENYGECETRNAMLKPGWIYEVRLYHAGSNLSAPDYDYQIQCSSNAVIVDDENELMGTHHASNGSPFSGEGKVARIYVPGRPRLVPDYDRDGDIDENDENVLAAGNKIMRFWINDDSDSGDVGNGTSDIPGSGPNYQDGTVNGKCDLVDFTPVMVDISGVFPSGVPESVSTQVVWKLESSALNAVWSKLPPESAGVFQTSECGASFGPVLMQQAYAASTTSLVGGAVLPDAFMNQLNRSGGKGVVLVEGCAAGSSISIKGYIGNSVVVERSLPISISSVENMYRWMCLRSVCGDSSGLGSNLNNPSNWPDAECTAQHFIFIHGYNVNVQAARGWAAEIFKRLWQSGLQAKFTAVDWFGDDSQIWEGVPVLGGESLDYYSNVRHALDTALNFAGAVNNLSGTKTIIAHSLGNMIVAKAAKDHFLSYNKFYMLNAAVPVEAFDIDSSADEMIEHGWDDVDPSKWAANWYEHITYIGDPRAELKWRGRFAGIHDVVNCYSPTEDVLANATANGWGGVWSMQELFKGTATLHLIPGNCEGGWGYNSEHTNLLGQLDDFSKTNEYTNAELIASPLFRPFDNSTFHQTNLITIAQTELNKVMGDGIPAISFAAGANPIESSSVDGNIELSTNMSYSWPETRIENNIRIWKHSDIRSIAFFYVKPIFKKITDGESQ